MITTHPDICRQFGFIPGLTILPDDTFTVVRSYCPRFSLIRMSCRRTNQQTIIGTYSSLEDANAALTYITMVTSQ